MVKKNLIDIKNGCYKLKINLMNMMNWRIFWEYNRSGWIFHDEKKEEIIEKILRNLNQVN